MITKELRNEILKLKNEIVVMKMKKNANTLKDTTKISKKRKEIARLLSKNSNKNK